MKLKRAILIAIATYALSFIIGLIPMLLMGVNTMEMSEFPANFFIIGMVISVALAVAFSLVYFRDKRIRRNAKEGFYFGIVLAITGFALDGILFLIGSLSGSPMDLLAYYANPLFWLTLLLVIITTTIVGKVKGGK